MKKTIITLFSCLSFLFVTSPLGAEESEPDAPDAPEIHTGDLLEAASAIGEQVAIIRGLPRLEPIPKGVKDRDELRSMLLERFNEEAPDEVFINEADVFKRMGLFPPDLDYRQLMLDLLTEQIAGFYDQRARELYIMQGLPEALQRGTIAHEIFHGIQDQHFDIGSLLETFPSSENADFALARMALIEGDASVVMVDLELFESGILPQGNARSVADIPVLAEIFISMDPSNLGAVEQLAQSAPTVVDDHVPSLSDSVLANAPPIVRDVLLFPYVGGMRFVLMTRAGRSWAAFNQIYDDPPASTSQIIHPERYFQDDYPLQVDFDLSDVLLDKEEIYNTVLGELRLRSWLQTHFADVSDAPNIHEIAAGWDGDRLLGYRGPDGDVIVLHLSSWRSEAEAQAFASALAHTNELRHDAENTYRSGEHGESWCMRLGSEDAGERVYVERWGELVLYIEGSPSRLDEEGRETDPVTFVARDAAWQSLSRVPFVDVLRHREAQIAREAGADQTRD